MPLNRFVLFAARRNASLPCRAPRAGRRVRTDAAPAPSARARGGYSLIEVMVATFLLAMGVLVFSALAPVSAKASKMNGNYAQAMSIAQHKVDQLRAVGYGRLDYSNLFTAGVIDASPTAEPFRFDTVEGLANYYPIFTSAITFQDVATDLKQATVTVSWTGQGDKPTQGNATLVALIARE